LLAPFDSKLAKNAQELWSEHLGRPVEWTNNIGMKFRLIPPGEFLMGAPNGEVGALDHEKPQHKVRITKPFYLGIYHVTQGEYQRVTGDNPSHFNSEQSLPVDSVSWDDAQAFLKRLNLADSGHQYRLPSEAEWEYACRAGTTTPFWFGTELNGRQANCDGNHPYGTTNKGPYLDKTAPVGKYGTNPFGIYDQHGQVWEWCQDWFAEDYYQQFANQIAVDPNGPASGSSRCLRGGSWFYNFSFDCRSASRIADDTFDNYDTSNSDDVGFRVVCDLC
jgi:formylglycine-generating enzyme required for sulfatase activity